MRLTKPMIPLAAASMLAFTLSACGGSSTNSADTGGSGPSVDATNLGNTGSGTDPARQGPVTIDGATPGGTVSVISYAGLNSMDPTDAYYTNTASILSSLVTRSLTQYAYDPKSGQMILVPDLATDLGTPNSDFTQWKFTLRQGVKWEDGSPVTMKDLEFGIERSFDRSAFPDGANYSNTYFLGGDTYNGPYKDKGVTPPALSVSGDTITIKMSKPFPDMAYWGAFPAMGAVKQGKDDPASYAKHPFSDGPYMFKDYTPEKSLTLVRNPNWDTNTDPGRTAYPDEYDMNFQTPSAKVDQIMSTSNGDGATTLSYDDILAADLRKFDQTRLVAGGSPCTYYWAPDYRKITDIRVRQALAYAYPYKDAILAAGLIDGKTRITGLGENLMPPGTPGRTQYEVNAGLPGTTDVAKAKQMLTDANALNYTIKWPYASDDPNSTAAMKVVTASLKSAGFDPQPIASTVANLSDLRSDPNGPENVRTAGWCSDWPSGGSWFPPLLQTTNLTKEGLGQNYAVFSEPSVDAEIAAIQKKPIADQPAAWDALDKEITTKYFPMFTTGYTGVIQMRGAKISGMNIDTVFGMPTWKGIYIAQ